jgi:hypothetical protein
VTLLNPGSPTLFHLGSPTLFHLGSPTLFHMGSLHPFEQALTLLLAFGPFVLLALVVWWRRREGHDPDR